MKWLVDHGMSRISNDIDVNGDNGINKDECYSPSGYCCGLSARAYYLKAYDVFDLLCEHGFSNFSCFDDGWKDSVEVDNYILQRGDERAIKILLSNGYTFSMFSYVKKQQYYGYYVLNRPQVQRKSVGLDSRKWSGDIPRPKFEKVPLLFGKKEIIARNSRRQEDYQEVRAYNEFVLSFGKDNYRKYVNKKAEFQNKVGDIMIETLKSQGLW